MVVDSHVHTRDLKEKGKDTISHALYVAKRAGVSGIFAMPNTNPPLTDDRTVMDYLALADDAETKGVFFGAYMALTADCEQVRRAVGTYRTLRPRVVGFKLYAGHSTNNIGVIKEEDQRGVFRTLGEEGYDGVVFVHAEKQSLVRDYLFDRANPISHALVARPPEAEVESIRDIIKISGEEGFRGKLHIAHISTPEGVNLVCGARRSGRDISCGVTPHHLLLNYEVMRREGGIAYKVNPPLRASGVPTMLVEQLERGDITWIETDHAPHELHEKIELTGPCLSGLTSLHAWPLFLQWLREGRGLSEAKIRLLTHDAVTRRFGIDIPHSPRASMYDSDAYKVNSWKGLENRLCG